MKASRIFLRQRESRCKNLSRGSTRKDKTLDEYIFSSYNYFLTLKDGQRYLESESRDDEHRTDEHRQGGQNDANSRLCPIVESLVESKWGVGLHREEFGQVKTSMPV